MAIFDSQRDRRADGLSVAHSGENVRAVLFDFLPPAASVAQLTAMQFVIDELQINGQSRGQAGQKRQQRLSMRFSRSVELQHLIRVLKLEIEKVKIEFNWRAELRLADNSIRVR